MDYLQRFGLLEFWIIRAQNPQGRTGPQIPLNVIKFEVLYIYISLSILEC